MKIVVTRIFNETEYLRPFIHFYKNADMMYVFHTFHDKDMIFDQLDNGLEIKTFRTSRFRNYKGEEALNNMIWKIVLNDIVKNHIYFEEDIVVLFADIDEFVTYFYEGQLRNILEFKFTAGWKIYRCISIKRYPKKLLFEKDFIALENIDHDFPITQVEDLWKDPVYKYPLLVINRMNIDFMAKIRPSGGFHRWIYMDKKVFLNNSPIFIINHIKSLNYMKTLKKLNDILENVDKDDWLYVHYENEKSNLLNLYNKILKNRYKSDEIYDVNYKSIINYAYSHDQNNSYFNKKIMMDNIKLPQGSKPWEMNK